jgi:hypothetical protein
VKKTRPEDDEARFVIGDVTFDLYQDAVSEMREGIEMWVDGEGQFHTIHVWGGDGAALGFSVIRAHIGTSEDLRRIEA